MIPRTAYLQTCGSQFSLLLLQNCWDGIIQPDLQSSQSSLLQRQTSVAPASYYSEGCILESKVNVPSHLSSTAWVEFSQLDLDRAANPRVDMETDAKKRDLHSYSISPPSGRFCFLFFNPLISFFITLNKNSIMCLMLRDGLTPKTVCTLKDNMAVSVKHYHICCEMHHICILLFKYII